MVIPCTFRSGGLARDVKKIDRDLRVWAIVLYEAIKGKLQYERGEYGSSEYNQFQHIQHVGLHQSSKFLPIS